MSHCCCWLHEPPAPIGGVLGVKSSGQVLSAQIGGISNGLEQVARYCPLTQLQLQPALAMVEKIATTPITANPTTSFAINVLMRDLSKICCPWASAL
jgi:hypothetical protein